jgi:hypothetical protein
MREFTLGRHRCSFRSPHSIFTVLLTFFFYGHKNVKAPHISSAGPRRRTRHSIVRNNIIVRILCQSLYNDSWFTDSYGAPGGGGWVVGKTIRTKRDKSVVNSIKVLMFARSANTHTHARTRIHTRTRRYCTIVFVLRTSYYSHLSSFILDRAAMAAVMFAYILLLSLPPHVKT